MKKIVLSAASLAVAAVASVSVAPTTSEAVPAFARQTGAACLNCHFGAIPRLAPMGREFRMNSFRDISQDVIEDEHLNIPAYFNASMLMKARIQASDATGAPTTLQWPDEAALLFGGRFSEHAGGFQEWDVISGQMLGGKFAYVTDMDAGILAVAIGTSDALGMPSVMNDPSNAISRNTRGIQSRAIALNGQPMIHDGATGVGVYGYLNNSIYFAVAAADGAGGYAVGNNKVDTGKLGSYMRAAFITDIAGFDTIIGVFNAKNGTNTVTFADGTTATTAKEDVTGVDIQLQGEVGGNKLGIYMPIVTSASSDLTGFQLYANYNLTHAAGVQLGYDMATQKNVGAADTDMTRVIVGAWYDLAQNIAINFEAKSTDNGTTTVAEQTLELEYVY